MAAAEPGKTLVTATAPGEREVVECVWPGGRNWIPIHAGITVWTRCRSSSRGGNCFGASSAAAESNGGEAMKLTFSQACSAAKVARSFAVPYSFR